jgi:hypothetical protein
MKPVAFFALLAFLGAFDAVPAAAQEDEAPPHPEALADGRLELRPYAAWAAIPNSVTGPFVGADVAFHLSPAIALGLDAAWYAPFDRSPGAAPSYPLNETRDSFDLDVSVSPWPAYRPGALEPYVLAGLGALQSRPIGVQDPANRSFSYNTLVDLSFGLGVHFFAGERVAMTLELRDLLYFEKIENGRVARGSSAGPGAFGFADSPRNPDTWYDPGTHLTNAIQLRLGASFFVFGG